MYKQYNNGLSELLDDIQTNDCIEFLPNYEQMVSLELLIKKENPDLLRAFADYVNHGYQNDYTIEIYLRSNIFMFEW